ncbi:histidinol phosphatase [Parapedobacter sp. ISTM3]|uniref:protein-tyrosine-phosphatase n=1 Tax=Parapedobacter luteus TaxID=623280 RepID=A0A1T5FQ08_9SPHI|nr:MULTISPECIES: CpsB/CapC family capsule biosynthesis tyrosine phosphatase [Parapedobacter]MBK1441643.1 histidinol phosphatase [Parapedobacter sp. ISTM3]SKB98211.1 Tyrosine-protein phosphatase YwqE [Parapedobacter luteus]
MGVFTFLNKAKNDTGLGWMGVDIHSHLLPGIDDGSPDAATSVGYIKRLQALGLSQFYATPHVLNDLYPNTRATINAALDQLKPVLPPDVAMEAAAEYMIDDIFGTMWPPHFLLTLPDNYLLIEMSYVVENPQIDQYIVDLQAEGYKIIFAHPERYPFYHQRPERYEQFKELGCLFQMNLLSPTGYYNSQIQRAAQYLLKRGMIDLVGTDLHHRKHLAAIEKFVLSGDAHGLFKKNPIKNLELFAIW